MRPRASTSWPIRRPHARARSSSWRDIRAGRVTGLFNNAGLEGKRRAQQAAVNESRLGIPLLFGADVIHGFRTVFPVPLAEAASWEPALAERTAHASRASRPRPTASAGPSRRWSTSRATRAGAAASRAPAKTSTWAGSSPPRACAASRARTSDVPTRCWPRPSTSPATARPRAGSTTTRSTSRSARCARSTCRPFSAAFDAGALSIMSAFNEIGGIPVQRQPRRCSPACCASEWGFQGFVVSDYTADEELIAHGFAADGREAAKRAFLAGTDVSMQSGLYMQHLPGLVASGEVPMSRARRRGAPRAAHQAAARACSTIPSAALDRSAGGRASTRPAHQALARDAARPLDRDAQERRRRAAACEVRQAHRADRPLRRRPSDLFGPWTLFRRPGGADRLEEAIAAALAAPELLTVVRGSDVEAPIAGGIAAAVAAAREADVVRARDRRERRRCRARRGRAADIEIPSGAAGAGRGRRRDRQAGGRAAAQRPRAGAARRGARCARDPRHLVPRLADRAGHRRRAVRRRQPVGPAAGELSADAGPAAVTTTATSAPAGRSSHGRTGADLQGALSATRPNEALYPFGHGLGYARVRYDDARAELAAHGVGRHDRPCARASPTRQRARPRKWCSSTSAIARPA